MAASLKVLFAMGIICANIHLTAGSEAMGLVWLFFSVVCILLEWRNK